MKNILLSMNLVLLSMGAFGQAYFPIPTDTATWRYRMNEMDPSTITTDFILYLNGQDTIIAGNTYKKIFNRGHAAPGANPPVSPVTATSPDIFYGGIRENAQKVYFITVSSEQLIFDFTATVGTYIPASTGSLRVTAIDSILVGSAYHKRYKTADSSYYAIEGVGSNRGLIPGLNDGSGYIVFQCFTHGADNWEPDGSVPCTAVYPISNASVGTISNKGQIRVIPNPAADVVHLECAPGTILHGSIMNSVGQVVWHGDVTSTMDIPAHNWASGLYVFFASRQDGSVVSSKIMLAN